MQASTSPTQRYSTSTGCDWCDQTAQYWFDNPADWNYRLDQPGTLALCEGCLHESGIRTEEPSACAEHPVGCPDVA